jgi:hypothetical protein
MFWRDHTFNPAGTQGAFNKISSQAGGRLSFWTKSGITILLNWNYNLEVIKTISFGLTYS